MKTISTLIIQHDRIKYGNFPFEKLKKMGLTVDELSSNNDFISSISISWEQQPDDLGVAYQIGALVESLNKKYEQLFD
jgi:hypothetical protein